MFHNFFCKVVWHSKPQEQEQFKLPKTFNTCLAGIQRELRTTEATDWLHLQEIPDFLFL